MVVVKWSACSPSTPTIWVRISLKSVELYLKRTKKQKEAGVGPIKKGFAVFGPLSVIQTRRSNLTPDRVAGWNVGGAIDVSWAWHCRRIKVILNAYRITTLVTLLLSLSGTQIAKRRALYLITVLFVTGNNYHQPLDAVRERWLYANFCFLPLGRRGQLSKKCFPDNAVLLVFFKYVKVTGIGTSRPLSR